MLQHTFFFSFAAALFQRLFIATRPSLLRSAGIIKPATSSPLLIIQTCAPKPDMCRTKETQNPVRHLGSLSSPFFCLLGKWIGWYEALQMAFGWFTFRLVGPFRCTHVPNIPIHRSPSLSRSFVCPCVPHPLLDGEWGGGVQIHFAKHKFVKLTLSFTVAVRFFSLSSPFGFVHHACTSFCRLSRSV